MQMRAVTHRCVQFVPQTLVFKLRDVYPPVCTEGRSLHLWEHIVAGFPCSSDKVISMMMIKALAKGPTASCGIRTTITNW